MAEKNIVGLRLCLLTVVFSPLQPTIRDPAGHTVIIPIPDTLLVAVMGDTHLLHHLLHIIDVTIILPAVRIALGTTAQTGAAHLTTTT